MTIEQANLSRERMLRKGLQEEQERTSSQRRLVDHKA